MHYRRLLDGILLPNDEKGVHRFRLVVVAGKVSVEYVQGVGFVHRGFWIGTEV